MLTEALLALSSTSATALVTAMVTDGWEGVRTQVARLFGRGGEQESETALERLDQSRAALITLNGADRERARTEQEIIWRTRLADLLDRHPDAGPELRELSDSLDPAAGSQPVIQQSVNARDQSQVAVQGHGVQTNTFGGQGGQGGRS